MDRISNKEVIEAVRDFKEKVNSKYALEKAILFGSRARGEWLYTSDVDLILVSQDFRKKKFTSRMADVLDYWNLPLDLEVLCYTPEEFERMKKRIGIVKKAVEYGIEIT
ncbi:MAG: nucleotidyltransferase domain-containing protein [Candidatus Altiarchaeales archaeon]|nr:nucleotidyltransferase domain-containing protein [Candidatus Altiarchaeales archaeon]